MWLGGRVRAVQGLGGGLGQNGGERGRGPVMGREGGARDMGVSDE